MTVESRGFKIMVLVGSGVAAGVTLANIIYYSKLKKNPGAMTKSEANTMMIINIILFVISIIIFLWAIWTLLFTKQKRAAQAQYLGQQISGGAKSAQSYLTTEGTLVPMKTQPAQLTSSQAATVQAAVAAAGGNPTKVVVVKP